MIIINPRYKHHPLRQMADQEWSKYFEHHDHKFNKSDHHVLSTMERHALCRRRGKTIVRFFFILLPLPLIFITMQLLSTSDYDSGAATGINIYDYILGVCISSFFSLICIVSHSLLVIIDRNIINQYHGKSEDVNNHLTGDDSVSSFVVFFAAFLNCCRGFIISTSVESWQNGIPSFMKFHTFAQETLFLQLFIFLMGVHHMTSTSKHANVEELDFDGTGTEGSTGGW